MVPATQNAVERQSLHSIRLWLIMLALHLPVYVLWGWVLFRHWADFWDAIVSWVDFENCYANDDEFWHGIYAGAKLVVWFLCPIGLIGLEMWLLGW